MTLELWGGHECSVNRVGGVFHDQTIRSGHEGRIEDLDRFAALGLKALRYPVLWERTAPHRSGEADWRWPDARLGRIRQLGMRPIVGLLHHGSGPRHTNLADEAFAGLFADYARAAAERYPWVEDWTPINEPLTTARFSALYGHWHPHLTDEPFFWAALLNQIDATRLAMGEIRRVNPGARLIQTEDLGRTYGVRATAAQAGFENDRRWMTWDLLCGRVTPQHPLWSRLADFGFEGRLRAIADEPCAPDVIGVNHYLTSERFLDPRLEHYPPARHGGNDEMPYADVEAVRVVLPAPAGLEGVLEEAWRRYRLPLAITECHNGCTREEQIRWVREAWDVSLALRRRDVDVRAVTAWALLGAFDWNSLLTRSVGHYEPGAFDVRSDPPRLTAVGAELRRLAAGEGAPHPAAEGPGWWRRDIRLAFAPFFRTVETPEPRPAWSPPAASPRPLLITGGEGVLGQALARACEWRGIAYRLLDRGQAPMRGERAARSVIDEIRPWAVVHAAGWESASALEDSARLAAACGEGRVPFVGFSNDQVFDGAAGRPYVESDPLAPISRLGEQMARSEREVLSLGEASLLVRATALFSPFDPGNFATRIARALTMGRPVRVRDDRMISPTYVPDLADAVLDLLIDGETGVRHLANGGALSRADFARALARELALDEDMVLEVDRAGMGWEEEAPVYAALATERGIVTPSLDNAIARWAAMIRETDLACEAEAMADLTRTGTPRDGRIRLA